MARRASSSVSPRLVLGAFLLFAGALAGGWFVYREVGDPFRTLTPLDVPAYLENANSLQGNTYKVTATVQTQLAWSPTVGRLYSVEVEGGGIIPVLIQAQFNEVNVQKGQRYYLMLKVGDRGILKVQDMRKV